MRDSDHHGQSRTNVREGPTRPADWGDDLHALNDSTLRPTRPAPSAASRARLATAVFVLIFAGAATSAGPATATSILRRAEALRNPDRDYAIDFALEVRNPEWTFGPRHSRYALVAQGKDRSLVLMREPSAFYPGLLLIDQGRYWLLYRRAAHPLEVSAAQVLAGDIVNGDLARSNLLSSYEARLDGEETLDAQACWRLSLDRRDPRALHPRVVAWIARRDSRPVRFEYHGATGTRLRTATWSDWKRGALGWRAMRLDAENLVRVGESTTVTFDNLRPIDASVFPFEPERLAPLRDIAMKILEAEGRQASFEELGNRLASRKP